MQMNADRASSVQDVQPAPTRLRVESNSFVSVWLLVVVVVLVAMIVWPQ
ncbi:MAG TPA: hypothetical protein VK843_17300 [Planctomycetota bacterium]|nr:hypothetical protein [Planctomycetota bacterium]